ncbi:MAG: hypothetical protein K6L74_16870 [Neptuniibacter sp.]
MNKPVEMSDVPTIGDSGTPLTPESGVKREIIERIVSAGESLDIELPETTNELQTWIIDRENKAAREAAKLGFGYLALKSQIEKGKFKSWLAENNLSEQRVYELISVANLLLSLSDKDKKKLLDAKKSQLITLAKLPAENIAEISETGELDELLCLPVKKLAEKIRNLETKLETKDLENDQLKDVINKKRSGEYPDFVVVTRHESDALSQKALLCMDDMSRLMDDLIKLQNDEHLSGEFENYLNMSSTTMLIHLNGMQAKLSQILHNAMHNLPPQLTSQQVNATMLYSEEEISHSVSEREMLIREHEQEKQIRANEREANKPRGRGRPRSKEA